MVYQPHIESSDSAVKQILLTMNEKQSFIIEDLDDHNVVIKADEEWRVRRELEAEVSALLWFDAGPLMYFSCDLSSWKRILTVWNNQVTPLFDVVACCNIECEAVVGHLSSELAGSPR